MKTQIVKGLTGDAKKEMEEEYISSLHFRRRLEVLIKDKVESVRKDVRQRTAYNSPSWAYEQADAIGFERACYEIISLISDSNVEKS
jgi:hypothetical protein